MLCCCKYGMLIYNQSTYSIFNGCAVEWTMAKTPCVFCNASTLRQHATYFTLFISNASSSSLYFAFIQLMFSVSAFGTSRKCAANRKFDSLFSFICFHIEFDRRQRHIDIEIDYKNVSDQFSRDANFSTNGKTHNPSFQTHLKSIKWTKRFFFCIFFFVCCLHLCRTIFLSHVKIDRAQGLQKFSLLKNHTKPLNATRGLNGNGIMENVIIWHSDE